MDSKASLEGFLEEGSSKQRFTGQVAVRVEGHQGCFQGIPGTATSQRRVT